MRYSSATLLEASMLRLFSLLLIAGFTCAIRAEEIPLESCDGLPVVQGRVAGMKFLLLVDTGATSMLNLKSFPHGDARKISVTSWNGTAQTSAQEVLINDLAVGEHHFKNLKLPAIDLSAIGRACGRQIDGIFGIDLLTKLGAVLDIRENASRLLVETESSQARVAELQERIVACQQAFNHADEAAFSDCLDPDIVLFTIGGDFYGRDAALAYYRQRYFQQRPPAQLSITPRAHHPIGDAIWVEYDLRVTLAHQVILARGTALCQKEEGKWRILHMNHSAPPPEVFASQPSLELGTGITESEHNPTVK
jgi:ketosteroid isomerase-like protein